MMNEEFVPVFIVLGKLCSMAHNTKVDIRYSMYIIFYFLLFTF